MTRKPLEGVKVIEVANWVSGPTCGVMLADYGAEVIKVEHLQTGGDPTRRWIPEIDPSPDLVNYVFEQINRGKRSLALDLGFRKGEGDIREAYQGLGRNGNQLAGRDSGVSRHRL